MRSVQQEAWYYTRLPKPVPCDLCVTLLPCRHAKQRAQQGEVAEAAAVLAEFGASPEPANFDLYKHIVGGVLALSHAEQSREGELRCQDFLWQLVQPVVSTAQGTDSPLKVTPLHCSLCCFFPFIP